MISCQTVRSLSTWVRLGSFHRLRIERASSSASDLSLLSFLPSLLWLPRHRASVEPTVEEVASSQEQQARS